MSKVLIDRELLERAVYRLELVYDADAPIVCDLSSVLSAPSGTPAMPVKAYYHEAPNEYGGLNKSVGLEVRKQFNDAPLVLESDAMARVSHLEGEIDKRDARIVELESQYQRDVYGLNNEGDPIGGDPAGGYANDNARLRSELARFSGTPETQVSVPASAFASRAITHYEAALLAAFPSGSSGEVFNQWNEARRVLASAPAAPAADAGLVYDKELHEAWTDRLIDLTKSYREAADGGEVRDAFRAIKAHIEVQPMSMVIEMTNNTIPNVPRELLERAWRALANSATGREIGAYLDADPCAPECAETCARAAMCSTCSAVLSAPSPAGVDGWEVECAATYVSEFMRAVPSGLVPLLDGDQLCRLSDAKAIIDGLRGEVERLQRAEKNDAIAYKAAIERQGELRTERDQQARRIGELGGLLRHAQKQVPAGSGLHMRIDSALSAGKEGR